MDILNKKASLTSKATLICLTIILTHLPCLSGEFLFCNFTNLKIYRDTPFLVPPTKLTFFKAQVSRGYY